MELSGENQDIGNGACSSINGVDGVNLHILFLKQTTLLYLDLYIQSDILKPNLQSKSLSKKL